MVNIYGQKGGSSSSSGTSEDPNTLTSRQFFKVIDWVSYGKSGGLRGDDIRKSVILNGSPVMNPDGSINHDGVTVEQRLGLPDQEYVAGFSDGVSSEESVGVEVRKDSPVVRTINNLSCDRVRVTIRFAQMTSVSGNTVSGAVVDWAIDVKPSDGPWYEALRDTVDGKTTAEYPKDRTVALTGTGPWNVRVRRLTDDSTSSTRVDAFSWYSYTEIIDGKFTWPNVAYVALKFDAKKFGTSLPTRAYDWSPVEVSVPSNYDPVAHTYSSNFWDGSFKQAATDNPIWHAYDVVTNDMSGVACDKFEMYELAQYCDETVSDGMGGERPRFTINTTLTERRAAIEWLSDIMSCCRGMFYWDGAAIKFLLDKPAPIERYLLPENVTEEGFKVQSASVDARYTVCNVTFNDPDNMFAAAVETVIDHEGVRKYGYVSKDVTAVGCTNRAQAHMYGKWVLYCDLNETHRLTFKPTIDNADLRPGMIIAVTDGKRAGVRLGGRIKSYSAEGKSLVVDKLPEEKVASGQSWSIAIRTEKGEWETGKVTSLDSDSGLVLLESALEYSPVDYAPWVMIGEKLAPEQWKVISISEDDGEYQVNAVEHHPNKYAYVEKDVYLEEVATSGYTKGALASPDGLSALVSTYNAGTQQMQRLTLSWTPSSDARTDHYTVSVKRPSSSSYEELTSTTMCSVDVDNAESGKWSFRVAATSRLGVSSPWSVYSTEVSNLLAPVAPDSVSVTTGNRAATLAAFKTSNVGQTFEFWMSDTELSSNIEGNARHVAAGDNVTISGLQPDHLYYFYVRGSNAFGVSAWYPLQAKTTNIFTEEIDGVIADISKEGGPLDSIKKSATEAAASEARRVVPEEAQKAIDSFESNSFTPLLDKVNKQGDAFQSFKESVENDQLAQNQSINLTIAAVKSANASVSTEAMARTSADEALGARIDTTEASLGETNAKVVEESKARASAVEAISGKVDTMTASINDARSEIKNEAVARADADKSISTQLTAMSSNYDDKLSSLEKSVTTASDSVSAVASDNERLKATLEEKTAQYDEQHEAQVSDQLAQNVALSMQIAKTSISTAMVSTETVTRANDVMAMAKVVTGVSAAVDDLSASVKTEMKVEIDKLTGIINSQYTISAATFNGKTAAIGLTNNGVTTDIGFLADRVWIASGDGSNQVFPFVVDGGRVMIQTAMIGNGTIGGYLQSDNYAAGSSGWRLGKDGNIEANNGTFRGQLDMSNTSGSRKVVRGSFGDQYYENGQLVMEIGFL